jgi:hypothetical protein
MVMRDPAGQLHHTRLAHLELSPTQIAVIDQQGDLFRGTQSREEPELVIVTLRLAPYSNPQRVTLTMLL